MTKEEQQEFKTLVLPHLEELHRTAYHLCHVRCNAEDLVMEAIAKARAPVCKSIFIKLQACQSFSFSSRLFIVSICSGVSRMSLYSPSLSDVVDRP